MKARILPSGAGFASSTLLPTQSSPAHPCVVVLSTAMHPSSNPGEDPSRANSVPSVSEAARFSPYPIPEARPTACERRKALKRAAVLIGSIPLD
jgi:hypothetical protein